MEQLLAVIQWDPYRDAFTIPFLDRPIAWYGLLFALGFMIGYVIIVPILATQLKHSGDLKPGQVPRDVAMRMTDALCWYVVLGTIIGARLGHVFFYGWDYYKDHLMDIPKVWEGGLASHGGAIGVLIAVALYMRTVGKRYFPSLTFVGMVDIICIPTAFVGFCIRLGNFFNQEIVGVPSTLPWAVQFGHPMDAVDVVPRHPAQLYEALAYLATFVFLMILWRRKNRILPEGLLCGLFFVAIFTSRFFIEFFKESLGGVLNFGHLETGQLLSLPFIAAGLLLIWRACCWHCRSPLKN